MRKVTRRLLTAGVAVLALGACQDSVTVVQPVPPPPPPPPPGVDATVSILGLRSIPAQLSVNPTAVLGDINVQLNVEEGDNTVTAIDLLLNGSPLGCESINTNRVPGEGVSLSASAADVVECFFNTDDVQGACVGNNLAPAFPNGTHQLGARITLSDGTFRTANNTQQITLVNSDFIMLAAVLDRAATIGTNGRAYVGGPSTLMDGSSNTVSVAACPVSYNGTTVASLGIGGYTTGGPMSADLGSGPATVHQDTAEPFLFTIDPTFGMNGLIEDSPVGTGHNFGDATLAATCTGNFGTDCSGQVFDSNGLNVTTQFTYGGLTAVYADFMGPTIAAGAMIEIDAVPVIPAVHYSGGTFGLSASVTDAGVGLGSGANIVFDVNDCDQAVGAAACANTPPNGGNTQVAAMETSVSNLGEDDPADDDDANGLDTYEIEVSKVADALENNATAAQLANIANNAAGPIGADFGAPALSNDLPATTPTDAPKFVLNDVTVMVDAADPLLASGDLGSQVDNLGCTAAADGTSCASIMADDGSTNYEVFETPVGSFSVDIADAGGFAGAALPDGETSLDVVVPDNAVLTPNAATQTFTFIYDTTGPDIKPFNDFEGNATLSGSSAKFDLAGQIADGDGVVDSGEGSTIATLTIGIFTDAGADCGSTTPADVVALTEGSGPGQVGNQSRSIADTDGGENDFTQNTTEDYNFDSDFIVRNPGAGTVQAYCTIVMGTDSALDKTGAANANMGRAYNRFVITWQ